MTSPKLTPAQERALDYLLSLRLLDLGHDKMSFTERGMALALEDMGFVIITCDDPDYITARLTPTGKDYLEEKG